MDLNMPHHILQQQFVKAGEYSDCHDADLVVICAGAAQNLRNTFRFSI